MKKKVLVTGGQGMLAHSLIPVLLDAGFETVGIDIQEANISDKTAIFKEILRHSPDFVVHAAAMTAVDACEEKREMAMAINFQGTANVAEAAESVKAPIIYISTDYVFNGKKETPYLEDDPIDPISVYGHSKAMGEQAVAELNSRNFIVRTAWLYGSNGKNFVDTIIRLASEREELKVVSDQYGSPTYTGHLSLAIARIVSAYFNENAREFGIFHATNSGRCSWFEFAKAIVERIGNKKVKRIIPIDTAELMRTMNYKAPRPAHSVLSNKKTQDIYGVFLQPWEIGLDEYMRVRQL